jgi:hypothetical protein
MGERFFRDLSEKRLKRGVFKSLEDLTKAVEGYINHHNDNSQPFIWTAKENDVLEKVKSARRNLNKLQTA